MGSERRGGRHSMSSGTATQASGAEELGWEWAGRWATWGRGLPGLAGPARIVLAQHRFGIKKLPFNFQIFY
jgi:hypothetical protein